MKTAFTQAFQVIFKSTRYLPTWKLKGVSGPVEVEE